jgi:hypothetical protein
MKPEEVPDDLIDLAYKSARRSDEPDIAGMLVDVLATLLPEYEKQLRAQIAKAIADVPEARDDEDPDYVEAYWDGRDDGARIARGESS